MVSLETKVNIEPALLEAAKDSVALLVNDE